MAWLQPIEFRSDAQSVSRLDRYLQASSAAARTAGSAARACQCGRAVPSTRMRLGYTSGHHIHIHTYGSGGGGFHRPDADAEGWFLWTTRQAAIQAGAFKLWQDCKGEALADHVRNHFAVRGVDVMQMPGEEWKRRLVSRAEVRRLVEAGPSAEDRAIAGLYPSSDALVYERKVGLTDVDYVPATPARAGVSVSEVLLAHYRGVIDPPSALTLKRRELKRARQEAAKA